MHYRRWRIYGDPLKTIQIAPGTTIQWMHDHIDYDGPGCLIWPFGKAKGRGRINYHGESMDAGRAMCLEAHGEPPSSEHEAAHNCGNGDEACVHPRHLLWATHAENQADMVIHGTSVAGEKHPQVKLTSEQARQIFVRSNAGEKLQDLATEFGVRIANVSAIKNKRSWAILHRDQNG